MNDSDVCATTLHEPPESIGHDEVSRTIVALSDLHRMWWQRRILTRNLRHHMARINLCELPIEEGLIGVRRNQIRIRPGRCLSPLRLRIDGCRSRSKEERPVSIGDRILGNVPSHGTHGPGPDAETDGNRENVTGRELSILSNHSIGGMENRLMAA